MIKYTLTCNNGHQFDSWFSNSESFDKLKKAKQVECAVCASTDIEKSLMAPGLVPNVNKNGETLISSQSDLEKEIKALKEKIRKTAKDVGENFSVEARAMHYGEKDEMPIVGKTTLEEARDLAEEGIPFVPLPWNDEKVN